jgi:hypothetical protein
VLRYQVAGRLPGGQARLERWGVRSSERILARHYGDQPREIGALDVAAEPARNIASRRHLYDTRAHAHESRRLP